MTTKKQIDGDSLPVCEGAKKGFDEFEDCHLCD